MLLPGVGISGQQRLLSAHVAIVGVGALGCHAADTLVRAGVGRITLIDRDVVELTNLQRQTLFTTMDARSGVPKAEAAAVRLREVNPFVAVRPLAIDLSRANALDALGLSSASDVPRASVLIDGTDNFETRYLLNDIAVKHGLALSYGGVVGTRGMSFLACATESSACLRCIFPQPPEAGSAPTCDTAGVLGPAVAIVAATQAAEVLKLLLGCTDKLAGTLLEFDLWSNLRRRLAPAKDAACPCCAARQFGWLDGTHQPTQSSALCGQDAVQVSPAQTMTLDLAQLAIRLAPLGDVRQSKLMVKFSPSSLLHDTPIRLTVFGDGRAIIHGTTRADVARSLYARFVGA